MRTKLSLFLKYIIILSAAVGMVFSFLNAEADGYSHPAKRLMYFTMQSNIWIALACLAIIIVRHIKPLLDNTRVKNILYLLRYIFTVSITLTGFIFCAVLAPGASTDGYDAWTVSSIITHVIVPLVSIADFFIDSYRITLSRAHIILTTLPPLAYVIFSSTIGFMGVDFGRGDTYPYFFLNYNSPAGFFGTSTDMPYVIGSFYWIIFILFIILGLAFLYRKIHNKKQ